MSEDLFAGVRDHIRRDLAESCAPSLAVSVARNGKILWEEAFGWADREKRIPATVHTMYSVASVSKPITATGLMVLVEQGKIDLDAPVNHYLSRDSQLKIWMGDPDEVTVRRLASHTSGLPSQCHYYGADEIAGKPTMEESIRRYGNIVARPGERYRYSNIGYGIMDHLIARVSGSSFDDFLRHEVFAPLGMAHASVGMGPQLAAFEAIRYDETNRPIPFYVSDHAGASEVYLSVHDLACFGMFHLGQTGADQKAILLEETRKAMQVPLASMAPVNLADYNLAAGSHYGLGWVIDNDDLGRRVSHGGGMGGAASKILMLPDEGIVIATASNQFMPLPWTIERDILSVLLPGYAEKSDEHWKARDALRVQQKSVIFSPVPELLGEWAGVVRTYDGDFSMTLLFKDSGDIHAKLEGQLPALVTNARFSEGRFSGSLSGRLNIADSNRRPWHPGHHLALELKLRGDVLNGVVVSIVGNSVSQWAEFKKV